MMWFRPLLPTLLVLVLLLPAAASATLVQSFQQTGQIDLEVVGAASSNPPAGLPVAGNLTLNNVVPGNVVKATLYAADWNNGGAGLDLTFGGIAAIPPTASPFSFDNSGITQTLYAYQWDVTNIVNTLGPSIYSYSLGNNGNTQAVPGLVLSVVYGTIAGPTKQITLFDGATQVAENGNAETESITFTGLSAGPTDVSIFTISDDASGTGEQVKYNTNLIGGPIDNNLGFNASLLSNMSTTSTAGSNQLDVVSSSGPGLLTDHFGWLYASAVVTPVPEPSTLVLGVIGLILLFTSGRHIKRRHG